MRLTLAFSALLIIVIDPAEPDRLIGLTLSAIVLYAAYSLVLYGLAVRRASLLTDFGRWVHWADVGSYVVLVALSSGTNSIFFFGFLFAIMVAAFRWGFGAGLRVTIASTTMFGIVGLATAASVSDFELNRFLVRVTYLLVLGYMMSYWGGREIAYKQRLALLREVTAHANPRFGIDRTMGLLLERLRAFYDTRSAILMSVDPASGERLLRRASRRDPEAAAAEEAVPQELGRLLDALPEGCAVVYSARPRAWEILSPRKRYYALDMSTGKQTSVEVEPLEALTSVLDCRSFISLPVQLRKELRERIYVVSERPEAFETQDIEFLRQVFDQVAPVIANIRLVDHLATQAANEERRRIALDLHDSVIQPYIGLQMGLSAVRQKLSGGMPLQAVGQDIEHLLNLTEEELANMRGYVRGLRSEDSGPKSMSLLPAVQRFSRKFSEATGIDVHVETPREIRVDDRLAADVFQMVAEGLSNVRRHTQAEQVTVRLERQNEQLVLSLENENPPTGTAHTFTPRSISERAAALGGHATVNNGQHTTTVTVEIPL